MLEALVNWDYWAFEVIYQPAGHALDGLMSTLSAKSVWIPLYLLIVQQTIYKYGKAAWLPLLAMILVVIAADQMTSAWMKPYFERLRPCYDPLLQDMNFTRRCGGRFGFASSHAANTMGLAVMVNCLFKSSWAKAVGLWAFGVAYSRVYLGVHFPLDVIAGMGTGALLSLAIWILLKWQLQSDLSALQ